MGKGHRWKCFQARHIYRNGHGWKGFQAQHIYKKVADGSASKGNIFTKMVVDGRGSKHDIFTEKLWMEVLSSMTYLQKRANGPRWDWVSPDKMHASGFLVSTLQLQLFMFVNISLRTLLPTIFSQLPFASLIEAFHSIHSSHCLAAYASPPLSSHIHREPTG